jgi:hypothetical protein
MAEISEKTPRRRPIKRKVLTAEEKARRAELKKAAQKLGEQEKVVFKETARLTDELTKIRSIEEERLRREQEAAQKKQNRLVEIASQLDTIPSETPAPSGEPSEAGKKLENSDTTETKPVTPDSQAEAPNPEVFQAAYAAFISAYKDKPVEFVRNVIGANPLPWQEDFLRAIAAGERRISVRAGHGVGKSTVCSWAMIWHLLTRYPQKTVCTAPTAGQLFDALFSELKFWINKLPPVLRDTIEVFSDRIVLKSSPEGSFISARTSSADRPEALAGIHSENVLLICDEASAIPEQVYESAAGSMSGHAASTILIGNPTRNSGLFFLSHHRLKGEWRTFHVPCTANPLVNQDFVTQIATTYGENSNAFRVRVLGEFALREDDTLIPAELIDSAMTRDIVPDPNAPLIYGLDVARFGDDRTVLVKRRGSVVAEIKGWNGADLMETVGRVMADWRIDRPDVVCVDSIGLGGGVADRLRELGVNVRDVNVSETAAMNPQAAKLRDELWLSTRDWLATRAVHIPKHDDLRQELVAPTYTFLSNGKLKVEGKGDMKKRGMRSPDLADALCLTFAGEAALIAGRASSWVKGQPLMRKIKGII